MDRMRAWEHVLGYVAGAVRDARTYRGWRQDDLVRLACLHRGAIARLEQGRDSSLPLRTLWAVATALGYRVEDLLPPMIARTERA